MRKIPKKKQIFVGVIVHFDGALSIWNGIQNVDLGTFKCIGKCLQYVSRLVIFLRSFLYEISTYAFDFLSSKNSASVFLPNKIKYVGGYAT